MNDRKGWKSLLVNVIFLLFSFSNPSEGWKDRVRLSDVSVLTLRQGHMTSGRRSSPVPQIKCIGGSAGCAAFVPKVVQCYNRGSDGYDVQWECKADMNNEFRFGEIAVNCEGYDYADDPYILKGSCGLEYTIDHVGDNSGQSSYHSGSYQNSYRHSESGYRKHRSRILPFSMSTLIMWGIIALIAYYIYSTLSTSQQTDNTQYASQQGMPAPPPGFRPEYTQDPRDYATNTGSSLGSSNIGGFWTGLGAGGLAGYLFGSSRGYGNSGYYNRHNPYYSSGYNTGYGSSWFGSGNTGSWFSGNEGSSGWFGGNGGSSGWFSNHGSSGSTFGGTHRRSSSSSSSSGSRTASGFGGTKRR